VYVLTPVTKKKQPHFSKKDPFASREAEKYSHPIPSREYILQYLETLGCPTRFQQLVNGLELHSEEEQTALRYRLKAMLRDGQLMADRRDRYCLINKLMLIPGKVVGHPDGYGFLIPDDGSEDLFLSAKQMRSVLHGDRVLARKTNRDQRGRTSGVIHEVIEYGNQEIVGRYFNQQGLTFVIPDNKRITQDIRIPQEHVGNTKNNQIVLVQLLVQPTQHTQPSGRIIEILGEHMAPGMEIDVAIRSYGLPHAWPEAVLDEIAPLTAEVSEADKSERVDLRDLPFVTIDGEDAQDFDDAVYCEQHRQNGWRLIVAIADVSHYVKPGTALDQEALERGNSVYFPERVLPMLPEILANQLCSLKPKVDRLCMVCDMTISATGKLSRYHFYPAIIHSQARLTYTETFELVTNANATLEKKHHDLLPHLNNLYTLYQLLHQVRQTRGAIDFDTLETRIIFDSDKKIKKISPVTRNDAHRIIEECMLMANVATAQFLQKSNIPGLYRVHDRPNNEKMKALREFLSELGLTLTGGEKPHAKAYATLLNATVDRIDRHIIQTVMLRSLSQAEYSEKNIGHFGLAFKTYTHFTSPIRRYPDLLVHRTIRHILTQQEPDDFIYNSNDLKRFAKHCSTTERRADEAARDVVDWLKCEYMRDKLGKEFTGVISTVTSFGIFVELTDIYVEGLVHITGLKNDYYRYDASKHRLIGERTHTSYRLGDAIQVRVARVNLDERKIDFELIFP